MLSRRPLERGIEAGLVASAFHFGYATFWGAVYALAYRRWRPHPLLGGAALGALIYAITFPHWGGAVLSGTEPPPHRRSWRQELVLVTAALTFGLGTALLYGRPASGHDDASDRRTRVGERASCPSGRDRRRRGPQWTERRRRARADGRGGDALRG